MLAPLLLQSLHKACTEAIIDGEMLAYDEDVGRLLKFGNNRTVEHEMQADPKSRRHLVSGVLGCGMWDVGLMGGGACHRVNNMLLFIMFSRVF
jgi:hypothetical protein